MLVDFLTKLFTSSQPQNVYRILEGVKEAVIENMNAMLTKEY